MRRALPFLVLLLVSAPASADIPGPNDHLCTVEVQAGDGAHCEACTVVMTDPSTASACDELAARGWVLRCGRGGTVHASVYCDRAAAPGAGCSASARTPGTAVPALASSVVVVLVWRRHARASRARRA